MNRTEIAEIAGDLQALQKQRAWYIKSRNMVMNRLQATVAGTMGYDTSLTEAERKKMFVEAGKLIKKIVKGEAEQNSLVLTTMLAINAFEEQKKGIEKEMIRLAKTLHVAEWVEHKDQRGFGILFMAIIIGETGDLANYANPGKVWRRLGCAPFVKEGVTRMGATWRSKSKAKNDVKLHASDWEEFGYSPRRRSISYLVGEGLMKQNQEGPYRKRYDAKKAEFRAKNPETSDGHCHSHGMLLAAKLLLKNLWIEWNGQDRNYDWKQQEGDVRSESELNPAELVEV